MIRFLRLAFGAVMTAVTATIATADAAIAGTTNIAIMIAIAATDSPVIARAMGTNMSGPIIIATLAAATNGVQ